MVDAAPARAGSGSGTDGLHLGEERVSCITDARLVTALASGEVGALAEAYDRHGPFVYGLGLRMCGQHQAEKMTQEVFRALWRSPAEFVDSAGSLRAALVADLHRRAAMCLRSQHGRHGDEAAVPAGAEPDDLGVDRSADQRQERVPSNLPHDVTIHLAYFRGYTYNQIAALLGHPEATVAAELHAQLRRLSTQIE